MMVYYHIIKIHFKTNYTFVCTAECLCVLISCIKLNTLNSSGIFWNIEGSQLQWHNCLSEQQYKSMFNFCRQNQSVLSTLQLFKFSFKKQFLSGIVLNIWLRPDESISSILKHPMKALIWHCNINDASQPKNPRTKLSWYVWNIRL